MLKESLIENLLIYHNNLSPYYIVSVLITFLSVLIAWVYNSIHFDRVTKEKIVHNNSASAVSSIFYVSLCSTFLVIRFL